jgi:hypothetical protein
LDKYPNRGIEVTTILKKIEYTQSINEYKYYLDKRYSKPMQNFCIKHELIDV